MTDLAIHGRLKHKEKNVYFVNYNIPMADKSNLRQKLFYPPDTWSILLPLYPLDPIGG